MKIRVRAALVETRTALINTARGLAKSAGERLPGCDADQMGTARAEGLPEWLIGQLQPLLLQVEQLTVQILKCDGELEPIARTEYPETKLLEQVWGVGTLIGLHPKSETSSEPVGEKLHRQSRGVGDKCPRFGKE